MKKVRIVMVGFGSVGQELARLLLRKEQWIEENHEIKFRVTGIAGFPCCSR